MTVAELFELEKQLAIDEYKQKIKQLELENESGSVGGVAWLEDRLEWSFSLIFERILNPFKKELEGNIVYYPDRQGIKWRINKGEFNKWLQKNFGRIDWGPK